MSIFKYHNFNLEKIFKSLSDQIRLRIMRILKFGSFHVNEILFIVNGKQSNISHHLKILQESGLIYNKREGSQIYYCINDIIYNEVLENIMNLINLEEKKINYYEDDIKRLDTILQKRKKLAIDFFNSVGGNLDDIQNDLFKNIYDIKEVFNIYNEKLQTILDIGCGTGRNLPVLAKFTKKIIGVDSSPIMIQLSEHLCKENNLNYELKLADINNLPFKNNSIDTVFINMVLHHISNPLHAFMEISRVLQKKGRFILIDLLPHQNEILREKYADLWLGFSMEELSSLFNKSGFVIEKKIIKQNNDSKRNDIKVIIIYANKLDVIEKK